MHGTQFDNSGNTYYLYLSAQYAALGVSIFGTDSHGNPVKFDGSQAIVDVTGQAEDVIQRIQATVSLTTGFNVPSYAVQSMETLCKAFNVQIVSLGHYGAATAPDNATDAACIAPASTGTTSVVGGGTAGH